MKSVKGSIAPFLFFLIILLPLCFVQKGSILLQLNSLRIPFFDLLFIKASSLGNGLCVLFCLLLILRLKFKWLAIFALAFFLQLFFVLLFKKGIYAGELRPYLYFKRADQLCMVNLVEGVKIRYVNTFPSGHTATIFFLVSFFVLKAKKHWASWMLAFIGLLVGVSRIYLIQHFFIDVYFGILFGTASTIIAYHLINSKYRYWHENQINIDFQKIHRNTQNVFRQLF